MEKNTGNTDQHMDLPVQVTREEVLAEFKQERTRAKVATVVDEVMETVTAVARPKGLYRISCTGARDDTGVEIDGVRFTSRVLGKTLAKVDTVIPYITTCGTEVDEIDISGPGLMRSYCLEMVKTIIMYHASDYFLTFLKETYGMPDAMHLHPGEFQDWPITEQRQVFRLFDDPAGTIGVTLTSTLTLQPIKSASGILFSNEFSFESCELCLQAHCPGRRKPYNPKLVKQLTQ